MSGGAKGQGCRFHRTSPNEGYERQSKKEIVNFLNYPKRSAGELKTHIYIGMEISYIERDHGKEWLAQAEEIFNNG